MYDFYTDGGHGWLKVSLDEIKKLGIADKISGYSYIRGGFAYLEEDCDLSVFAQAKGVSGSIDSLGIKEHYSNDESEIRNYARYPKEGRGI